MGDARYFNQDRSHQFLSPAERLRLIRRHEKGNCWIAQELLGRADGRLFYDPVPEPSEAWEEFKLREIDVKEFFLTLPVPNESQRDTMSDQVIRVICGRLGLWAKIRHEIVVLKHRLRLKHYSLFEGSLSCNQKHTKECSAK
jgi:hypothetical protein